MYKRKNPKIQIPQVRKNAAVEYLIYPSLERTGIVRHAFSTRLGGVSEGIFSTMNFSAEQGDDPKKVLENYRLFAEAVGFDEKNIVVADQTHTAVVRKITEADRGNGVWKSKEFFDVDGMITNVPGLVLSTSHADCVPLYFVDPVHRAIGLSHSGWRGTVGKIGKVTLEKMHEEYGTDAKAVIAAIGPSICVDCYEVSADVAEQFRAVFSKEIHEKILYAKENGKYQLDLWEANRQILLEAGVPYEQIEMPNLCTCCNPDLLFSHRASHGKRGNLRAFLMLEEAVK